MAAIQIRTSDSRSRFARADGPAPGGGASWRLAFDAGVCRLRRRRPRHRRRRQRLPRFCRRHRGDERRPLRPARRRRAAPAGESLHPHRLLGGAVRELRRAGRAPRGADAGIVPQEDAVREQRRRGDRERGQDRAPRHRPSRRAVRRRRLPRPHAARAVAHQQGASLQDRIRPVRRRRLARAVSRIATAARSRARIPTAAFACVSSLEDYFKRNVDPADDRRDRRRAGARRGRVHRAAGRLPVAARLVLPQARHPLHRRRSADRLRPDRPDVRVRARRRRARSARHRQVARRRPAARRRRRPRRADGRAG